MENRELSSQLKTFRGTAHIGGLICLFLVGGCAPSIADSVSSRSFEPGQAVMFVADCDQSEEVAVPNFGPICPQVEFVDDDGLRHLCSQLEHAERDFFDQMQLCTDYENTYDSDPILEEIICIDCIYDSPKFMTWVWVLAVRGNRVLFRSRYGLRHHTPFDGWVDKEFLIRLDQFTHVEGWPRKFFHMEVCLKYEGCREIDNWTGNDLTISFSLDYGASCPFERDHNGDCEASGDALKFDDYLYFATDLDSNPLTQENEFQIPFLVQQDGRLCWAPAWQYYKVCMPLKAEYYNPTTPE